MKHLLQAVIIVAGILVLTTFSCAQPKVQGKTVEYNADGVMKGYLAYDENIKEKRPGVLVVHEWWGLNDYVRMRARMLAELDTRPLLWTCMAMEKALRTRMRQENCRQRL